MFQLLHSCRFVGSALADLAPVLEQQRIDACIANQLDLPRQISAQVRACDATVADGLEQRDRTRRAGRQGSYA